MPRKYFNAHYIIDASLLYSSNRADNATFKALVAKPEVLVTLITLPNELRVLQKFLRMTMAGNGGSIDFLGYTTDALMGGEALVSMLHQSFDPRAAHQYYIANEATIFKDKQTAIKASHFTSHKGRIGRAIWCTPDKFDQVLYEADRMVTHRHTIAVHRLSTKVKPKPAQSVLASQLEQTNIKAIGAGAFQPTAPKPRRKTFDPRKGVVSSGGGLKAPRQAINGTHDAGAPAEPPMLAKPQIRRRGAVTKYTVDPAALVKAHRGSANARLLGGRKQACHNLRKVMEARRQGADGNDLSDVAGLNGGGQTKSF